MIKTLTFLLGGLILIAHSAMCSAASDWRDAADGALRAALSAKRADVSRWDVQPLLTSRMEERLGRLEFVDATPSQLGARSSVRIRGKRDGRLQDVYVWYSVHGYRQSAVATVTIRPGAALTQTNVAIAEANVLDGECAVPSEPMFWLGTRAKHSFAPGDRICAQAIEPMPLVVRGESVAVKSVAGPVTITARGVAQEDGDLGTIMRVQNPGSGETFTAAVSGRGEVVVRE